MKEITNNSIYHIVDENFLNKFNSNQKIFMENLYYSYYLNYCKNNKINPKNKNTFFTNMRKQKIKLIQSMCPFCRKINLTISTEKIKEIQKYKYCTNCGKKSVYHNSLINLSRFIRIFTQNRIALDFMKKNNEEYDDETLTFDMYHLEIVELTSIIEVSLRDFFYLLVKLNYNLMENKYFLNVLDKYTGNDFMNIQKANNHYKKALNINLKELINDNSFNLLLDICSIRNVVIHNNGFIDENFLNSKSYKKYKNLIVGNMLFLNEEIIKDFYFAVTNLLEILETLFNQYFENNIHSLIVNYYFNQRQSN